MQAVPLNPTDRSSRDRLILVTGPTRSGKSEWAERLASEHASVIYIATAQENPDDPEWQARIDRHRQRRPNSWMTQAIAIDLPSLFSTSTADDCLLIDSLGTWLANVIEQDEETWTETLKTFLQTLESCPSRVILVAEETGWGIVPAYPIGRTFRDRLGQLTRHVGAIADSVYLVTGGYALNLTQLGDRIDTPSL